MTPLDDLTSLTKLGLQHNNISNVTPLKSLVNLTWLRLAGNSITDLSPLVTLVNVTNSDVDLPEPDTTVPGVSISVPSGTQTGAFDATITFTETVSGFVQSEVSLSGSAASITSWSANGGNTVYTATITPTGSGTVTIGVAANVATDAANNQNTAATSKTVTVSVDTTAPGVSISVPSGTQTGAFDATITFTESVSGFVQSDVSLSGSAASITSWSANSDDTVYTATITPTASGTVTIGVAANVATDAANNQNTAAASKTVTVNIPALIPDPATWMPDANLRTAVRSALGIASDANFSKNDLSTLTTFRAVQSQVSHLTGLEHATNLTSLVAFQNQISSLTPLENLTSLTEIRMGNNDISDVTPLDDLTSLTKLGLQHNSISNVTPLAGLVNLTWLRLAGNSITDLSPLVTLVNVTNSDVDLPDPDTTAPGVSISVPSGSQTGAFDATITFTETVSGFVQSEVSLSGSAASITSWSAISDDTVYTATITPTASGTVTIGVAANVATDAANNPNIAATSKTVTVDVDAPGASLAVPSGTQTGAFDATITFTETVSGFAQSEVSLSGSAASITSWSAISDDTVYTATITPTASGTVTIGVAANVATDAANNQNTAATSKTVTVNIPAPIPDPATWMPDANLRTAVRSALGIASGEAFSKVDLGTLTSFSAPRSQITNLTGLEYATNLTSLVAWGNQISSLTPLTNLTKLTEIRIGDNQHIQNLTPLFGLTKLTRLGLQGNNISDVTPLRSLVNLTWLRLVRNPITDFSPLSGLKASITDVDVTIPDPDTTSPSVSITVPSGTQNGAFDVTITFTETVSASSRQMYL